MNSELKGSTKKKALETLDVKIPGDKEYRTEDELEGDVK